MNTVDQPPPAIVSALCASLQQGIDAAEAVTAAQYGQRHPEVDADSIGAHLRHHIEHMQLLLAGRKTGIVDYDARERDGRIETDPEFAIGRSRALMARIAQLDADDLKATLRITQQVDLTSSEKVQLPTTLGRELLFMHSHAVHHYAIIAMLLRAFGQRMGDEFGVMPSTTVWRQGPGT